MLADGLGNSGYELVSEDGTSTKYIIAFSSGIVESERPLARNLRLWGKLRRELPNKTKVVSFDSRHSVTASRADEWLPINPGSEGALAMAIAHVIIAEGLYDDGLRHQSHRGIRDLQNGGPGPPVQPGERFRGLRRRCRHHHQDRPGVRPGQTGHRLERRGCHQLALWHVRQPRHLLSQCAGGQHRCPGRHSLPGVSAVCRHANGGLAHHRDGYQLLEDGPDGAPYRRDVSHRLQQQPDHVHPGERRGRQVG